MSTHLVDRRTRRERLLAARRCPLCDAPSGLQTVIAHPAGRVLHCGRCTRVRPLVGTLTVVAAWGR